MLRFVFLWSILFGLPRGIVAQNTFSKVFDFGYSTKLQMIELTDYGYMVVANAGDTIGPILSPLITAQFSFEGDLIDHQSFGSEVPSFLLLPLSNSSARLNDSTLVAATWKIVNNDPMEYVCVYWLNNYGDTLMTRSYTSPNYSPNVSESAWHRPAKLVVDAVNQDIYYVAQVLQGTPAQNQFMARKLNSLGEIQWTYLGPVNSNSSFSACKAAYFYNDSFYVQPGAYAIRLSKLNSLTGMEEQSIDLNQSLFPVLGSHEMIMDNEGVTTACVFNSGAGTAMLPALYKMDYNGNYLWHTVVPGNMHMFQDNNLLARANDGGFVACSTRWTETSAADDFNIDLWLWKVDASGDFQWDRHYSYLSLDSLAYSQMQNQAFDFKATLDGGYICAGESYAACANEPDCTHGIRHGWLLKVDGCGCLVPGCDEACSVGLNDAAEEPIPQMKIGPNPSSDQLFIYVPPSSSPHLNLACYDMTGRIIHKWNLSSGDITLIVDTTILSNGTYMLQLSQDNAPIDTQRFVVDK